MNENTTYRTCLYGVDALALVEYGAYTTVITGGASCGFQSAWLATDGQVCFRTYKETAEDIVRLTGKFLLGMSQALPLSGMNTVSIPRGMRNVEYGPAAIAFVGTTLAEGAMPRDTEGIVQELGHARATAMITPMNPAEVEFATNFDIEYAKLVEATEAEISIAVDKYNKTEVKAREEFASAMESLRAEKTAELDAIKSRAADKAVSLLKELGVDLARHPIPSGDYASRSLAALVEPRVERGPRQADLQETVPIISA